ncbi:Serpin-ZX [Capsicum chinense]|nr:Serpin-ZX [Capsicum chinense]
MYYPSQFEYMHLRASIQKQTDVSTMLAKHVFFSKFESTESNPNDANMVFSPLSIQIVLGLIAAGSSGDTLEQLLSFLKFNSVDELNSVYSRIIANVLANGSTMGGPRLSVANGAWIKQTLDFNPSFKQVMDNVYKAAAASVDFQNKADKVAAEINKWAEVKTNGLIKEILPPGAVDAGTSLVLGNAIYFKGAWTEKLNAYTKHHEFHLLNVGVSVQAPFMTGVSVQAPFMTSKNWQYVKAYDGFKVLRLPYKQGEDKLVLSMYMFLPNDRDGLPALLEKISSKPGFLDQHVPLEEVRVRKFLIPKFKISFGIEASKVLKGLGLTLPFIGGLTEIVGNNFPLAVSKVFHKSFIEVNEEGTEATAVTFATMRFGSSCGTIVKEEWIDFVADHPFLFFVKDETSSAVLFMGTLLNPLAA